MTAAAWAATDTRRERVRIDVHGTVQGVGFRPFASRHATALGLSGFVANTPEGVVIEAEGAPAAIAGLLDALEAEPPPNAAILDVAVTVIATRGDIAFDILESVTAGRRTAAILPDLATCEACLAEIRDPLDRRYRYPFTNCTHCGPRYAIIESLPYDRARTSMRAFPMCRRCSAEYRDPLDRRFHAEPNACPACGPRLSLQDAAGATSAEGDDALMASTDALRDGAIVAAKGLGGFHLLVDARNGDAIDRLRRRKQREDKPFAVMFASLAAIRDVCAVSAEEAALLVSRERPIVLLRRTGGGLSEAVAPGCPLVGAFLPYTPLHHLLLDDLGFPLVATSGNRSSEPIVTDEREALTRLAGIADLFLVHDRPIVRPVEDSVARIVAGRPQVVRRARGYAPAPVAAPVAPGILAFGGHQKSAVALSTPAGVVVGPHIGDLDTPEARDAYDAGVADIIRLHDVAPRLVASDLHPDYYSTRVAGRTGVPVAAIQHHAAHVAACMAEHGLSPPVLGVAWDGTGFGPDGTIWGGEFLRMTETGWERVASFHPFRLPGGEAAVREPRRSAIGLLFAALGDEALAMTDLAPVADFTPAARADLGTMLRRGVNAPETTSAGRLFDAVAALLGLRQRVSYEGQAAAELEWAATTGPVAGGYEFPLRDDRDGRLLVDWAPALRAILADIRAGIGAGAISAGFHDGLARMIAAVAARIGLETVVLTGGCFQNARLSESAIDAVRAVGATPRWHERVPPNDGGLALGQVWLAAATTGGG
ncbi:MAG: carbamoyltransferase HypF [Bauldia sp.]|nr:carbamoyltransferase HypF [Bauldia sp.]